MKTQATGLQTSNPIAKADRRENAVPAERVREEKRTKSEGSRESKESKNDWLEAVKEHITEKVQWKRMRFYRHEEEGHIYVDIMDRKTGEVIKTLPESDFVELAGQLRRIPGLTIDING